MSLDPDLLAEKAASIERHLARVAILLPDDPADLLPETEASDGVVLHLWQATQVAIDLAMSAAVRGGLGSPSSYGEAFRKLALAGILAPDLAERLARAAGFRNLVVHAYSALDLRRVHEAAKRGPRDLRALLVALRDRG